MSSSRAVTALLGAATVVAIASVADRTAVEIMAPGVGRIAPAVLVNAGAATVAWLEDAVTRSGALVGGAIGTTIYLGAGWEGWLMLGATFVAAVIASNIGRTRKHALGLAQEQEGRRDGCHVVANCGVAGAAALVAMTSLYQAAAWLALVAALTAAGADTVASEVGKARGGRTFLIVGLRPVPAGTPGAISLQGSVANVGAAIVLAAFGAALGLIALRAVPLVAVAAVAGASIESVLAATLERAGILNTHHLNFITTASAAILAIYLI